jgi:hypothetical protein
VFRAQAPGRYRVEVHRDFALGTSTPAPSDAATKAETKKDDHPSWPPRAWDVIIGG